MIEYKTVSDPDGRARVCDCILRALPDWFGIEESIMDYAAQARELPFYAAFDGDRPVGFAAVKTHTRHAAEVCVMGILRDYHRMGIGKKLIGLCEGYCRENGHEYLTVKTLAEANPDKYYARTRLFYLSVGFVPLEVFPLLWDEANPCLMMVKRVAGQ